MIRALLVDDEAPARQRLQRLLMPYKEIQIVGEVENGLRALEEIERVKPELVFLDIEMPELDGFGVAETIGSQGPTIVFITAYDEHALRAFKTCAIDYLVKPVSEERLGAAIRKVTRSVEASRMTNLSQLLTQMQEHRPSKRMAVRCGTKYLLIDPSRISAIIAQDHYASILFDGKELLVDDSLDLFEKRLNPNFFIRAHRSALINIEYLSLLEREGDRKYTAILSDPKKSRIPIARERLTEVKAKLGLS